VSRLRSVAGNEENNKAAVASGGPIVDTAPLPARAQFLNVIESIFSGMARAIIHNSTYRSVEEAKGAINRYFDERNRHFREHPRRAGKRSGARSEYRLSSLTGIAAKTRDSGECVRSNVRSSEGPPIRRRPLSRSTVTSTAAIRNVRFTSRRLCAKSSHSLYGSRGKV
jgi:hypothetical protein